MKRGLLFLLVSLFIITVNAQSGQVLVLNGRTEKIVVE